MERDERLENTHKVCDKWPRKGYQSPRKKGGRAENEGKLRGPADNGRLLREHGYASDWPTAMRMIREAGFRSIMADMAMTVDPAHPSGPACPIAHPGPHECNFTFFDLPLPTTPPPTAPPPAIPSYHPYH